MKVIRNPEYLVEITANLSDEHIWAAITPPRTWIDFSQGCAEGTVFRVLGYTFPIAGAARPISREALHGTLREFMLEVQYLVPKDRPDEAHIMYAFEADERGFWEYGGAD